MNWENIGKLSFAIFCGLVVGGIICLIIKIVSWKWHVDSEIEAQDIVNKEVLKALEDIKDAVKEAITEEGSEE